MKIKSIPIEKIKPYKKNAKLHPEDQIIKIANSIKEFGFKQPIVIDKNHSIIVGHGRYEAATYLKLKNVPCLLADDLTPAQVKAYRLADNKLNESEWDLDLVIPELKSMDMELAELTGFDFDLTNHSFGKMGNDWNYNYKNLEQKGDNMEEEVGFVPHSMWYDIPRQIDGISDKLIALPVRKNENPHQNKYSRTNAESIRRIVATYMRPGDYFLENCCGWSTFGFIAKLHGYSGVGVDIWDTAIEYSKKQLSIIKNEAKVEIQKMDGMKLKFKDEEFNFIYCNPPFMDIEMYSGEKNDISDPDFDKFVAKFEQLMKENYRCVKQGGLCTITVGDRRKGGALISLQTVVINAGLSAGFRLHDFVICEVLGVANMYRKKAFAKKRMPKNHEYVITFIK